MAFSIIILPDYKSSISKILIQQIQKETMSQLKNYYEILGVNYDASTFDIENAYQKLAAQWHPDKHKTDRAVAQRKFHDISEAYEILSDNNKRNHYDAMLKQQFSIQDANKTFERFFGEHGIMDAEEQKFFRTNYPEQSKNYYSILGLPRNASLDEIKRAYRKLSLKYHPKNNPNSEQAHKRFVDVNEAYNALSNYLNRRTYDDVLFGQIEPFRAHAIFDDFFGNKIFQFPQEDEIFRPIVNRSWRKRLDNMMDTEQDFGEIQNGESVKTSTVYTNNNGVQSKKTVSTKKKVKDGKALEETTKEYLLPTGEKQVTKTIKDGNQITTKNYHLKKGEQAPKELTN